MFQGSSTALITPFKDGKIDKKSFEKIIERQLDAGTNGLVPCGTTGETPTLSHKEHDEVVELCVKINSGQGSVIAGTGSNSTAEAIRMTQHSEKVGADAALIMVPYYNKPTQTGIYEHFKAIHDNSSIPLFIYNVPSRTVVSAENKTIARLAALDRIVGIKDATGDLKVAETLERMVEKDFIMLSGEDDSAVEFNEKGGQGCISVTSNIAPELCAKMQNLCLENKFSEAKKISDKLSKLHDVMFCETNPIPVKYACHLLGLCKNEIRLPLTLPSKTHQEKIKNILSEFGIL